jgi:rubredoxin
MNYSFSIKINFTGGVISPGSLLQILSAVKSAGISHVNFGLRQQLLIEVPHDDYSKLTDGLKAIPVSFEVNDERFPNIISSYPAEEIFITKTWLSEGVYKDIFDSFDYQPRLKINISDANQSFTPLFTGNINWVASPNQHFWHLSIRFPKTNVIYNWKDIVYTNDIATVSKKIERIIFQEKEIFFGNSMANGNMLYKLVTEKEHFICKVTETELILPPFTLPYYEGFNKYHDKYWLGIYRRNEQFHVNFLIEACKICLSTKVGQLCSTPWKSLIIKGIEEKDRNLWNELLGKHQINVRHAANELNFQVEDNCKDGLALKEYLVRHLNKEDTRTFGICIGIKTRHKSEVFSSILVRKKSLFTIAGIGFFSLYDILFATNFNPNERTGKVFSRNNIRLVLPEVLRRAIITFYRNSNKPSAGLSQVIQQKEIKLEETNTKYVYQCKDCHTIYDETIGEPDNNIAPKTPFIELPESYCCSMCEASKTNFKKVLIPQLELI